ncbi:MAG TPA: hypothetical protein V6D48_25775 [Oculatellaceae cyanobacterium]
MNTAHWKSPRTLERSLQIQALIECCPRKPVHYLSWKLGNCQLASAAIQVQTQSQ